MAETKVTSIRADEETTTRFKKLLEQSPNSSECLKGLINAYEMAQAKSVLTGQETNISDFQNHLDSIMRAYVNVLDLTANAENRIRDEFRVNLESKDKAILDLQERIKQAEQERQSAKESESAIKIEMAALREQHSSQVDNMNAELDSVRKELATVTEQVTDKQLLLDEYRTKLEKAEKDVIELPRLREQATNAERAKATAEKELEHLREELNKQKLSFDEQIKVFQERASLEREKAVLEEKQKHIDEIKELYAECDKLRQIIAQVQTEKKLQISRKNDGE